MERVDIQRIAVPRQRLPVRQEFESGQLRDRPARGMIPRKPLRIQECERPGSHRNHLLYVKNAAGDVRGIHNYTETPRPGDVAGLGNRVRDRLRRGRTVLRVNHER